MLEKEIGENLLFMRLYLLYFLLRKLPFIKKVLCGNGKIFLLVQKIAGDELHEVLQIRSKIPRRKAISLLEEKVINILTDKGYISTDGTSGNVETIQDLLDEEDEDEEIVVDGEVDEGDVHIKPVSRKPTPLVSCDFDNQAFQSLVL